MSAEKQSQILTAARGVFLRYGYKRVTMSDIAEAAGVSRPALYVEFKNKEEIFSGVYLQWVDETLSEIDKSVAEVATFEAKLESAFEIWTVRPFEVMRTSPEARELFECSFGFAQAAMRQGYKRFEAALAPILELYTPPRPIKSDLSPKKIAHVLASAVRGFKQTATTQAELRLLIRALLALVFGPLRSTSKK